MKFKVVFALSFAASTCFATWLVIGESSPFREYFLYHVTLPNFVMKFLLIPYVAVMMAKAETDFEDMLIAVGVEFLQWLVVGYVMAVLLVRVVGDGQEDQR